MNQPCHAGTAWWGLPQALPEASSCAAAGAGPAPGARMPGSGRLSTQRSAASGSHTGRSTAGAGRSIALTPRQSTLRTAESHGSMASRGTASSVGRASNASSTALKAELEAEQQRRVRAEQELERLQLMLRPAYGS
mmetsp:Transcript_2044/g.6200  ORF Transcript_2044/g.6200 Transcript_2044/m.6200 type:complete len:136 (+) Transcript_2044:685-1092(+)